ncbi:MAG: hypothetical protein ACOZCO_07320 [Bacteroidota bacterium]
MKKKFIEQKEKMLKKLPLPLGIDEMLNQLAEVIYHSYFKKYPHELQKIIGYAKDETDIFKAA